MGRVLLVFKTGFIGCTDSQGLGISAHMAAKVLRKKGLNIHALGVFDGYELEKKLTPDVCTVVFYAPWIDIPFLRGLCKRWPGIQFTVTVHSNIAFLQSDVFAIRVIREGTELSREVPNFTISANSKFLSDFIHKTYSARCPWLPNLYDIKEHSIEFCLPGPHLKIGLFGAVRQLKNILTGVGAAILVAKNYKPVDLYINGGRVEGGEGILRAIDELSKGHKHFRLHTITWLDWHEFTKLVGRMDILLQPSFSESFNNVTADGAAQYIPTVTGTAITWVPSYWQVDEDNVEAIADKIVELLETPQAGVDGNMALRKHNRLAIHKWTEYLYPCGFCE